MKLLDSDLLGILLALAAFIVPAVSGVLEKKRKEKKKREAEMYPHAQPVYPQEQDAAESEDDAMSLNEEVDELFNILMGRETAKEEEILPDSHKETHTEEIPVPMHQLVEENVEYQTEQVGAMEEPEPKEDNSLKKRIKGNPKEAIILSEILSPKFKEWCQRYA